MRPPRKQPHRLFVAAGPNGSGKTTFARKFLPTYAGCLEFINADLIAAGVAPFHPQTAALQAGRMMLSRLHELARCRADFAFETTLSGRSYLGFFRRMRNSGYEIHLFYLWIPDIRLALKRIAERVKSGGHDIPRATVVRRFKKSLRNLFGPYWDLLHTISLIDNSAATPRVVAFKQAGELNILDPVLFRRIEGAGHAKG